MSTEKKKGGRPRKLGLEYYPLHATLFDTKKMRLAEDQVDPTGENMMRRMLVDKFVIRFYSTIFLRGYFIPWNEEEEAAMCKAIGNGTNPLFLRPFLNAMLEVGLLNKELYHKYNILTSRGIQQRWMKISKAANRDKPVIDEIYYIHSEKNEFLRDGKRISFGSNASSLSKKPVNNTISTANNTKNTSNNIVSSEKTPVSSRSNHSNPPEETGVSLSTTTISNSILSDSKLSVVVEGNVREETPVSSRRNANNSQLGGEETGKTAVEGEFLSEETTDTSIRNHTLIPSNSQLVYRIEDCAWNYLYNKAYERTREQHQINWGTIWDHDTLEKWIMAFNRALVTDTIYEKQFNGKDGYARNFRNWVLKITDYQTKDPNTLYTKNDIKHGNKQQGSQSSTGNDRQQPPAGSKVGGVQGNSIADILNRKK